jgi:hypothetical protein
MFILIKLGKCGLVYIFLIATRIQTNIRNSLLYNSGKKKLERRAEVAFSARQNSENEHNETHKEQEHN